MIKDLEAYRARTEREDREALERMSTEDSLAIAEALLTSELMDLAEFPDDDNPRSLAISLGLDRKRPPQAPAPG